MRDLPDALPTGHLNGQPREWLEMLPPSRRFETPLGNLLLCHGLGDDDMAALKPDDEGYEVVDIGIKDNTDLDNGRETKVRVILTAAWQAYEFDLGDFLTADLSRAYVVIEFVFSGATASSIEVRRVAYESSGE